MTRVEEGRGVVMQIVAVRAEVVVDHVKQYHQAAFVSSRDKALEVFRTTVGGIRREGQNAVITPVAPSREIGNRHEFQGGYAKFREIVQPFDGARKTACRGETADVEFIDHRFLPGAALPSIFGPLEGGRVNHFGRTMYVIGIKARDRVGNQQPVGQPELVTAAGASRRQRQLEPARTRRHHGHFARLVEAQGHRIDARSPQAKTDATALDRFGAKRH